MTPAAIPPLIDYAKSRTADAVPGRRGDSGLPANQLNLETGTRPMLLRQSLARLLAALAAVLSLQLATPAMAEEDAHSKATSAVTEIIFDYNAEDFVVYNVRENGYLDITFARNTPDPIYNEMLEKLRGNPAIKGVMAGRGGPACSRF